MSILSLFTIEKEKFPFLSSFEVFVKSIKGQKFNSVQIRKNFNKLVSKSDYDKEDKRELLKWLNSISK